MENNRRTSYQISYKGRPEYYIAPTRDFTKYTRDCEEKYWKKETAFDWTQNVRDNLKKHLEDLGSEDFAKIAFMTLPILEENFERKILQIEKDKLPVEEDALKGIEECVPFDRPTLKQALLIQLPLQHLLSSAIQLKDQIEIIQVELSDLREQQRLGLVRKEVRVERLESEVERQEQITNITRLKEQITRLRLEYSQIQSDCQIEATKLKAQVRDELIMIEQQVLDDLKVSLKLVQQTLLSNKLPNNSLNLLRLKDLILKRQIRGLKDIANHALVVEQSAIAPLTMGIILYKRHREIQEAMTTFINDEAKHSATFRRFLAEKLEAREFISDKLIKGANRYMWLARFMPGVGLFFAVVVEAIGAAVLEFFGNKIYMPDKLFCSICKTISEQDEVRHLDLCVDMYNELYRGHRWAKFQNRVAFRMLLKSVYGDKTEDNHLIQAFRAFGVESQTLYQHIFNRVSQQLARIGMYVEPEKIFAIIGQK